MSRLRELLDAISLLPDARAQLQAAIGDSSRDRAWAAAYELRAQLLVIIDVDCERVRHVSTTRSSMNWKPVFGGPPRIMTWTTIHPQPINEKAAADLARWRFVMGPSTFTYPLNIRQLDGV